MATATKTKITYSSAAADMEDFHKSFDEALQNVRKRLGKTYPLYIDGKALSSKETFADVSPIDTGLVLGRFSIATEADVNQAVVASRRAQKLWGQTPWPERLRVFRRAANGIRERKFELASVMGLEVGKSRLEAMGDVEESADLIDYYCQIMEEAKGFDRPLGRLFPNEKTRSVLRPYGIFACIAPFNFPLALSVGMSSAALIAGNTIIYKPPQDAPWTGLLLYEIYSNAGLPTGVFQYLSGKGSVTGTALWKHPGVDGVVFTGSKDVGMEIYRGFSTKYLKPVLMELGGKNPAVVTASANLERAVQGVVRSAFGLQGQKCSACSRIYVDKSIETAFLDKLLEKTRGLTIGDPTKRDVFFGPVINERAVQTFEKAIQEAKNGGEILIGGLRLAEGALSKGHYVAPTIARLPLNHPLMLRELFVPFLGFAVVSSLEEAITECNKVDFGLTAGIFSQNPSEIEQFFNEVEAGVCYANRATGATTGAWPGVQSFCGWKGSGSTGKGGCGPYYVAQFMREQSRTIVE